MTTQSPHVVIGAGLGGLATALRLAHRGEKVLVFEKTDQIGGRNRRESVGECHFDGGPTLMMMLEPFEQLFTDVGEKLRDHLDIKLCDPSYRTFFRDGSRIDGTPNIAKMLEQMHVIGAHKDAGNYPKFLGEIGSLYNDSIDDFVRNPYGKLGDTIQIGKLKTVFKHNMLGNLAKRVARTFEDERLRMLFSFQTMYLGLSPYDAPWVYSTLAYMEYGQGIWYPKGGLPKICEVIAELGVKKGVEIRTSTLVTSMTGKSVTLESGEVITAKSVICNADMPYGQRQLLGKPAKRKLRYSCSAYLMYMAYRGDVPELLHHNVIFGKDFKGNLDAIFKDHKLPEDPSFYVCISKRSEPCVAPDGMINLFVLVPCPNLDLPFDQSHDDYYQQHVFKRLEAETTFSRANVIEMKTRTPQTWQDEMNLEKGAAFGISADLFQSAFMRPKIRSKDEKGVYFVGASTTPGNGLPMVLISAELTEKLLREDGLVGK